MNDPRNVQELVALLREHRDSLEGRLAEERVGARAQKERGDRLMTRLEKMRDQLIDLIKTAKAAHKECRLRSCASCSAIKLARKTLDEFRWD